MLVVVENGCWLLCYIGSELLWVWVALSSVNWVAVGGTASKGSGELLSRWRQCRSGFGFVWPATQVGGEAQRMVEDGSLLYVKPTSGGKVLVRDKWRRSK